MSTLTDEQKEVVRLLVKNSGKQQVQTLGGYAGTGKTTVIYTLHEALPSWAVCAYTGKAANVCRRKGMEEASTIHSLIYKPDWGIDGEISFRLAMPHEIAADGFLVDEASMVSKEIYDDLLSFNRPVIFVGDHGQLEPVGTPFNVMETPQYRLETVHRNAGPIAHFAEHIRKGGNVWDFGVTGEVHICTEKDINEEHLVATDQIICAFNRFRVDMNARIRRAKNFTSLVERGERVMCLKNNRVCGIFNGMQGKVVRRLKDNRFDFKSFGTVYKELRYDPEQFGKEKTELKPGRDAPNPFDYAYCITCHKSQGDEFGNVVVYEQVCDKWDHVRWAYTAASRAKDSLIWITKKPHIPNWL
jgi:exodeoxyribonuclease-5